LIGTKGLRAANPAYEYSKAVKLSVTVDEKTAERKFPKGGSVRRGNSSIFLTA
jgi:hypothetical protein